MGKYCSTNTSPGTVPCFVAIKLNNKSLLRVSGPESFIYLQSLLTNDMRKLLTNEEYNTSMEENIQLNQIIIYSYLLSDCCKVLCDLFVYRGKYFADGDYILEVDRNIANAVKRLLLSYHINKNIKVEIANDLHLWSVIPYSLLNSPTNTNYLSCEEILRPLDSDDIKLAPDSRIGAEYLGYRFLTRLNGSQLEDIGKFIKCQSNSKKIQLMEGQLSDYIRLRYKLGIAEGNKDILSGFYFPIELNADFLNAISLDKGLFTSEEKVIKIFSNTIKKRLFPVKFKYPNTILRKLVPAPRTLIGQFENNKFGELRQRFGKYGIAYLPVPSNNTNHVIGSEVYRNLVHNDTGLKISAFIPKWWPENYNEIYLPVPTYPDCMFNLQPKTIIDLKIENDSLDQYQSSFI